MKSILVVLTAVLLCGCNAVYIPGPIGTDPVNLQKVDWEGTWLHADGSTFHVKVLDGSNGVLRVGWVETDSDDMEFQSMKAYLREAHGWTLASFEIQDDTNAPSYVWGIIVKDKNQVVGWGPDVATFKGLVEDKVLPGEVQGGDVHLGELSEQHLEFITAWTNGLLEWDEPVAFIKICP